MNRCEKCGYELNENDKFCSYCGAKVEKLADNSVKVNYKENTKKIDDDKITPTNSYEEFHEKNDKEHTKSIWNNEKTAKTKDKTDIHNQIDDDSDFSTYDKTDNKFRLLIIVPLIIIFIAGFGIIYMIFNANGKDNVSNNNSSTSSTNINSDKDNKSEQQKSKNLNEYILPFSDKRPVTKQELKGMNKKQLALARNEIFARHGYIFGEPYKNYFASKSWYKPNSNFKGEAKDLSALERHNIKIIMIQEGLGKNVAPGYDSDYNESDYSNVENN